MTSAAQVSAELGSVPDPAAETSAAIGGSSMARRRNLVFVVTALGAFMASLDERMTPVT